MESVKAFLNKISELAGGFDVTKEMIEETESFLKKKDKKEKKKVKKEKKDVNAPKKPTNAYMIYAKDMRSEIAEDSGITVAKDLVREIARRWNEEKKNKSEVYQEYTQKLNDAKEKYTSDMEDYVPSESSSDEKEKKTKKEKKEKKDPNAPKKPTNAYMIYAKEMRSEIAEDSGITVAKDLVREIARRWNEEKKNDSEVYQEYTQKLNDAKEKYASDMEEYTSSEQDSSDEESKEEVNETPKKVAKTVKIPEAPKKAVKPIKKVEDDIPEPPKKAVKKIEYENESPKKAVKKVEDEEDIPEPPKKADKKGVKKANK